MTRPFRASHASLALIALYLALGLLHAVANPALESSDEPWHYGYVWHLAQGGGLPVQVPGEPSLWEQEGSQPPLYYALAALLTRHIDADDLHAVRRFNPHARIGVPLAIENKNMLLHPTLDPWPWRGTVLAVRLIRLLSVALGAGAVCTWLASLRELFPRRPDLALTATAVGALTPMYLFISASVNNDNLVVPLAGLTLWLMLRLVRRGGAWWQLLLLGITIGLACLSKVSALGLLPVAGLAVYGHRVLARHEAGRLEGWRAWAAALGSALARYLLVLLPAAAICGWWYLRNWQLYGEPLGIETMLAVAGRRESPPTLAQLLAEFEGLRINFWGLFGAVNVLLRPRLAYRVLDAACLVAAAGLLRAAWRHRRTDITRLTASPERLRLAVAWLVAISWLVVIAAALVRWTSMTMASQGRLLFPAMPVIAALLVAGLSNWSPSATRWRALLPLPLFLGVLAATAPFVSIRPAYTPPPVIALEDISPEATPYGVTFGDAMRLEAFEVAPRVVDPGEALMVTLYWHALAPMDEDYSLYLQAFGRNGERIGQRDSYPAGGLRPTSWWALGEVRADRYLLPIAADAEGPVAAEIEVGLYHLERMERLPAVDPLGQPLGRQVIARVRVSGEPTTLAPSRPVEADYDGRVRLAGYDLAPESLLADGQAKLTLYWQATDQLDRDYVVFAHLVDADGRMVAQGDGPPLDDEYPTSFWMPGDSLVDRRWLRMIDAPGTGPHRLLVGWYDPVSGDRLPVREPAEAGETRAVLLGEVHLR